MACGSFLQGYGGLTGGLREDHTSQVLQIFPVPIQIEGQPPGKIPPDDPVYEELADLPFALQDALRPDEDLPLFIRHGPDAGRKDAPGVGLVHPEIEEIQGVDDDDPLKILRFSADRPDELLWGFEHLQNVLLGKQKFEAGVSVEELAEFCGVIPFPQPEVFVTVGQAFDDAGDAVGSRLGDHGCPFLQDLVDPLDARFKEDAADRGVEGEGERDGEDGSEEASPNRSLRQTAEGVVAEEVLITTLF